MHEVFRHDLLILQGTTSKKGFPVVDKEGNPVDLTAYTVRSQIRDELSRELLYEFVTSTQDNMAIIEVVPSASSAWTWTDGVYDVEIESPQGVVTRIAQGKVRVNREVTL